MPCTLQSPWFLIVDVVQGRHYISVSHWLTRFRWGFKSTSLQHLSSYKATPQPQAQIMTVADAVEGAVGLSDAPASMKLSPISIVLSDLLLEASREAMSEAKLPIRYRDSCANLLIPLNRCRYEEYYLPWKCEVCGYTCVDAGRRAWGRKV